MRHFTLDEYNDAISSRIGRLFENILDIRDVAKISSACPNLPITRFQASLSQCLSRICSQGHKCGKNSRTERGSRQSGGGNGLPMPSENWDTTSCVHPLHYLPSERRVAPCPPKAYVPLFSLLYIVRSFTDRIMAYVKAVTRHFGVPLIAGLSVRSVRRNVRVTYLTMDKCTEL